TGHRLRAVALAESDFLRRTADRPRPARHPQDERLDFETGPRRLGHPHQLAPAAPARGGLLARADHEKRETSHRRRHGRDSSEILRGLEGRQSRGSLLPRNGRREEGLMIGALMYLQLQSLSNRLRVRLRRLRKPKYLAGALVGGTYFYFFLFRDFPGGRAGAAAVTESVVAETRLLFELLGALALCFMVLSAWLFPHERAALAFTEAEIAFLFPAPVTRRTLVHFKLLRAQAAILFTTV